MQRSPHEIPANAFKGRDHLILPWWNDISPKYFNLSWTTPRGGQSPRPEYAVLSLPWKSPIWISFSLAKIDAVGVKEKRQIAFLLCSPFQGKSYESLQQAASSTPICT